jgi:hypothetical protein
MSSRRGSSAGRGAIRALALTSLWLLAAPSFGEEGQPAGGASDLAALLQDPLATLAAIGTDNRAFFRAGEDNDEAFLTALQPVYSLPFEDQGFVLIPRLNIPIISLKPGLDIPRLGDDGSINGSGNGRETGLSDMGVQLFGSPLGWDLNGWKLGAGPQFSFKTRTDKDLKGAGYGAGLSGVVAGGHGDFSFAALIGHLWGFDGDFSTTAVQPMIYYNFPALPGAYAYYNNAIAYDWEGKGGSAQRWTVPIGMGLGNTFDLGGGYGLDIGAGYYYQPSFGRSKGGPEHQLQVMLTVIVPHKKLW